MDLLVEYLMLAQTPLAGKEELIVHCNKMLAEMAGSKMNNTNIIKATDTIAIQGYCSYTNQDDTPGRVEYCDIYKFDEQKLFSITSYIIEVNLQD
jgi:hypothetical protein